MTTLVIHGVPQPTADKLPKLIKSLQSEVSDHLSNLNIPHKHLFVFFPADLCRVGLGEELICMVQSNEIDLSLNLQGRRRLLEKIHDVLNGWCHTELPTCKWIGVSMPPFDQERAVGQTF